MAALVIVVGATTCLALNLPGHLSYDSVVQLAEGRAGVYGGLHPPVMSWLLGVADTIRPGAALFVVFDEALITGALAGLILLGGEAGWPSVLLAAVLAAFPQLLIYPAIVWKDVLFAAASCAGFASLAASGSTWDRPFHRFVFLALALALLTLAALARQNGAVVLPIAAVAAGWMASAARKGGGYLHGLGFLAVGAALFLASSAALDTRLADGPATAEQWRSLQTYDLVAARLREPGLKFEVLHQRAPALETLITTKGVADYSPVRIDSIEPALDGVTPGEAETAAVAAQWRDLILHHPLLYLRVRSSALRWVLLTPKPLQCGLLYTGVDGPAEEMGEAGLAFRRTPKDKALAHYGLAFAGTPVFSHAAYVAAGLILLVLLLRRRQPADIAVAAMVLAAMAFVATFALISIACDYRYLYDLDLSVIAAALYAAASFTARPAARGRGRRRGRPSTSPR